MPSINDKPYHWCCCYCETPLPKKDVSQTEQMDCTSCKKHLIVSAMGRSYPFTMMGFQSADWDNYHHHNPQPDRKPIWMKKKSFGSWHISLFADKLVLSKNSPSREYEGGSLTWHPFSFGWGSHGWGPHLRLYPMADRKKRLALRDPKRKNRP